MTQQHDRDRADLSRRAFSLLALVGRGLLILCLFFVSFGPPFSFFVLDLLYGSSWSTSSSSSLFSAPFCLGLYTALLLPLLGANGVMEAFVVATLKGGRDMHGHNGALLFFSFVHVVGCVALLPKWGAVGLVVANAIQFLCRLGYSFVRIRALLRTAPITTSTATADDQPWVSRAVLLCFLCSAVMCTLTDSWLPREMDGGRGSVYSWAGCVHATMGIVCFLACCLAVSRNERELLVKFKRLTGRKLHQE